MSSETFPAPHEPENDLVHWWPKLWAELEAGATQRKHGFHTGTLATIGLDGAPEARSVVLRRAAQNPYRLYCHTDRRATKCAEIAREPRVSWHFYDFGLELQLRITATAEVLTSGEDWEFGWDNTKLFARRCYLAPYAPGTVAESSDPNLPPELLDREPTLAESEPGREHFAVLRTTLLSVDVLSLHVHGHRRAAFDLGPLAVGPGFAAARWLAV